MNDEFCLPFEGDEQSYGRVTATEDIDPALREPTTERRLAHLRDELYDFAQFSYASLFHEYETHSQAFKVGTSSLLAPHDNLYPVLRQPSPGDSNSSQSSAYHHDEMRVPPRSFSPLSPFSTSSTNAFDHQSLPYLELGGGSSVAPQDVQYIQDEQPELHPSSVDSNLLLHVGYPYSGMDDLTQDLHEPRWIVPDDDDDDSCADADGESAHPTSGDDGSDSDYIQQTPSYPTQRRSGPRRASHGLTSPARTTHRQNSGSGADNHSRISSTRSTGGVVNGKIKKRTHHRSNSNSSATQRAFPCLLHRYGCDSTFSTKNEWKRHINTQHLRLGFWRCDQCPASRNDGTLVTVPNDFNRKDLFTQHLRRMHLPKTESPSGKTRSSPKLGKSGKSAAASEEVEGFIAECQLRCYVKKRSPPLQSHCVFASCKKVFEGPKNWEERLEHVGRHLEKMAKAQERHGQDPGRPEETWMEDLDLRRWLEDEGLIESDGQGGWRVGSGAP